MEKVLEKECLAYSLSVCKVVPAALKENIGDYAAIAVADMNRKENA
jgi:glucokinase